MAAVERFDTVIVGSGFGGSVTAYRHATADRSTLVLERGKSYPPGSFPRAPWEMSHNFWDPDSGRFGLFQVWRFRDIDGLVSAGLGGGSLIYANVLIRKDERWFVRRAPDGRALEDWPITRAQLDPHYDAVEKILAPQRFPFDQEPYSETPKTRALKDAAEHLGLEWFLPELAVSFADPGDRPVPGEPIHDDARSTTNNLHGRTRTTCRLCGECDIGCNYGSKNTLDYNYLTLAKRAGAELRTGAEVRTIAPDEHRGYLVGYVQHDLRAGPGSPPTPQLTEVACDRLVLSAGTFGTIYLLLRNADRLPNLSPTLGKYFSGNGDYLGLLRNARMEVGGKQRARTLAPSRGSVITSSVRVPDTRDGGSGPGYYVQDGGYPDLADWFVEATGIKGVIERGWRFLDWELKPRFLRHENTLSLDENLERLIGDGSRSSSNLPLLGMGLDTPGGEFTLDHDSLRLDWNRMASEQYFARVKETMKAIAQELGAQFEEDPISLVHGKLITVHPVGGCAIGSDPTTGVVDTNGEVFGHDGLSIADGSVMPAPVGPNPSFTIAALADHFADSQTE